MMRKLLLNGLVTVFVVFLFYGVAQAQPNLSLPTITTGVGTLVDVGLDFENNGEVVVAQMDILFDSNVVSIDPAADISASAALDAAGFTLQASDVAGGIRIVIFNLGDPAAF
jgi:hypothetical protein